MSNTATRLKASATSKPEAVTRRSHAAFLGLGLVQMQARVQVRVQADSAP